MSRFIMRLAVVSILILAAFVMGYRSRPAPQIQSVPTVERLTNMGRLDVLRVELSDVRQNSINGYAGSGSILLILHGQVVVGIDLTHATLSTDSVTGTTVLTLPNPEVTQARVDAERSRVYRIDRDGLWQLAPSDELAVALVNKALTDAQQAITAAGSSPAILTSAKLAAEQLLQQWATAYGWHLQIHWQDQPETSPISPSPKDNP